MHKPQLLHSLVIMGVFGTGISFFIMGILHTNAQYPHFVHLFLSIVYLSDKMALFGHISVQEPQEEQIIFLNLNIFMALVGHTLAHNPQPMHVSNSGFSVSFGFLKLSLPNRFLKIFFNKFFLFKILFILNSIFPLMFFINLDILIYISKIKRPGRDLNPSHRSDSPV